MSGTSTAGGARKPADHYVSVRAAQMATRHVRVNALHDYSTEDYVLDAVAVEAAHVIKALEALAGLGLDTERTSLTTGPFSDGLAAGIAKRLWREFKLPTFVWGGPVITLEGAAPDDPRDAS